MATSTLAPEAHRRALLPHCRELLSRRGSGAAPVERSYARTMRIAVSARTLSLALDSVDGVLSLFPQIHTCSVDPTDTHARCRLTVPVGPSLRHLDAACSVDRLDMPRTLRVLIHVPALSMRTLGVFDFTPCAAGETALTYTATMTSTGPTTRRIRSSLSDVLEDHVDSAAELLARLSRQYTAAKRLRAKFSDHRLS